MDGETDIGLFEIILILAAVGVGGYFIYKYFVSSCSPASIAQSVKSGLCKLTFCGQIGCCAVANQVQKNVGCACAANYGITSENKLNACGGPAWYQLLWNYVFGTSYGVGSGTAGGSTAPASASTGSGQQACGNACICGCANGGGGGGF